MMEQQSLLITRKYFGLGDWVMFQSVLKSINKNYPDLKLDVDITMVPNWFQEMTRAFDHKANLVFNPLPTNYTHKIDHVIYLSRRPKNTQGSYVHLIESMLENISYMCNLPMVWDGMTSTYIKPYNKKINSKPYVVIPSMGSKGMPEKSWDLEHMQNVSKKLAEHVDVIQIGTSGEPLLEGAKVHLFDLSPHALQEILANAACVLSFENGISHWCGHIGAPCVTLYIDLKNGSHPYNTGYKHQIPLIESNLTVEKVTYTILKVVASEIRKKIALLNELTLN